MKYNSQVTIRFNYLDSLIVYDKVDIKIERGLLLKDYHLSFQFINFNSPGTTEFFERVQLFLSCDFV